MLNRVNRVLLTNVEAANTGTNIDTIVNGDMLIFNKTWGTALTGTPTVTSADGNDTIFTSQTLRNKDGNDRSKNRDEYDRKKNIEKSNTSGDSNSNNLFSSNDFSHLRKPDTGNRTVKITDFVDEKSFALSALKDFLKTLEVYLMKRR